MRIVIDKDVSEIQLLQESWERGLPTYKVLAIESDGEKFVYGKELVQENVVDAVQSLIGDDNFKGCNVEVVECSRDGKSAKTVWASDEKTLVSESTMFSEGFLDALKKLWSGVTEWLNNKFGKFFDKWKQAKYVTKDWQLTGLGYKVAMGEVKPKEDSSWAKGNGGEEAAPVAEADNNVKNEGGGD